MATGTSKTKWSGKLPASSFPAGMADMSLYYEGKRSEQDILATKPSLPRVLWSGAQEQEINFLYYGDNLPILASLLQNPAIRGKVKLIYIDPRLQQIVFFSLVRKEMRTRTYSLAHAMWNFYVKDLFY